MKLTTDRGWTAHSHHVKRMLGLDVNKHLPAEGMAPMLIQGISVYVKPLDPKRKSARQHRVMAICPLCNKHMSAGRIHQHAKIHEVRV